MKRFIYISILILFHIHSYGQSAQGRYSSLITADGTLFFINPYKLNDLKNIKRFEYDMTLLSWSDSATVNFTFESERMVLPDNLSIESGSVSYPCDNYSVLFIDIKKNHYEIRITCKYPIATIDQIIDNLSPPIFQFKQDDLTESATYKKSRWEKDRKKLSAIFNLYKYSKIYNYE